MRGLLRPHPVVRPGLLEALRTQLEAGIAKSLRVTGPVTLLLGAVADQEYLMRDGTAIVGGSPAGNGDPMPPGAITAYGGAAAPGGWLLCDGAAISRETYGDLFTIIGTAYGVGNGSTTFNIPNLKQRFPLGKADSGTGDELGEVGGAIDHDHTYDTVIAHLHSVDPPNRTSTSESAHTHSVDPPNRTTTGESSHIHSVNPPNRTSTGESSHTHFSGIVQPGAGSYTLKQTVCGLAGSAIATSAGSSHTHDVDIPAFNSGSGGNHTHAVNIPVFTSGAGSGHTHDVDIPSFNSGSTGSAEGTTASENPPFQVVNYIIKT